MSQILSCLLGSRGPYPDMSKDLKSIFDLKVRNLANFRDSQLFEVRTCDRKFRNAGKGFKKRAFAFSFQHAR